MSDRAASTKDIVHWAKGDAESVTTHLRRHAFHWAKQLYAQFTSYYRATYGAELGLLYEQTIDASIGTKGMAILKPDIIAGMFDQEYDRLSRHP